MKPKSMRNADELLAEFNKSGGKLTPDEERLVDLLVFKKTGKRTEKFKEKKKGTPTSGPILSKKRPGVYETPPAPVVREEVPVDGKIIVHSNAAQTMNNNKGNA